jgi:hypothetical protein
MHRTTIHLPFAVLLAMFGLLFLPNPGGSQAADPASAGETVFELSQLNGVWVDMVTNLAPIERGPITVVVSSPHHRVAVHRNQVRLTPLGDGRVAAFFEVELEGEGELIADLQAGMKTRIEDEVTVPRQTLTVEGIVRLSEEVEGIRITLEEMPEAVEITIESRLLRQLVHACAGFGSFLGLDCDAFGRDLESQRIPIPPAGESVLLPNAYLTKAERAIFERLAKN